MYRDRALLENTKDWLQDHVRWDSLEMDGPALPPPWWRICIDEPRFVRACDATFMREDDYVIGLDRGGVTKAYPVWIVDYYHFVYDRMEDEPFVVFS